MNPSDIHLINQCIRKFSLSGIAKPSDLLDELQHVGVLENYSENIIMTILIQNSQMLIQLPLAEYFTNCDVQQSAQEIFQLTRNHSIVRDNISGQFMLFDTGSPRCFILPTSEERMCLRPQSWIAHDPLWPIYGRKYRLLNFDFLGIVQWPFEIAEVEIPTIGLDFMTQFNITFDCLCEQIFQIPRTIPTLA